MIWGPYYGPYIMVQNFCVETDKETMNQKLVQFIADILSSKPKTFLIFDFEIIFSRNVSTLRRFFWLIVIASGWFYSRNRSPNYPLY